jgi:HKD family nuclease
MIVKKLHARFINDKILVNAEQCYIASAAISSEGFEFVFSRLPKKCKGYIVTGLEFPTEPAVLWKMLKEYYGRVSVSVITTNAFHANAYLFDMPYRKRLGFISSANFTAEGLQHNEELSYRIDTEKEVEEAKVWFTQYFESGEPLTEKIIRAYEAIYSTLHEHGRVNSTLRQQFIDSVSNIDTIEPIV